jgi:hypothetical protein
MVFNSTHPDDMTQFKEVDWKHAYGNVKEALPHNAPEPQGKDVDIGDQKVKNNLHYIYQQCTSDLELQMSEYS